MSGHKTWAEKQYAAAKKSAARDWGDGWGLLSQQQRLGAIALRALGAINASDAVPDSVRMAAQYRELAALVLSEED